MPTREKFFLYLRQTHRHYREGLCLALMTCFPFILTARPVWMTCENRRHFCLVDMVRVWVKQEGLWKKGQVHSEKSFEVIMAVRWHWITSTRAHLSFSSLYFIFSFHVKKLFSFTTHCIMLWREWKDLGKVQLTRTERLLKQGLMWGLIIWRIFEEQNRPRKSNPGNTIWLSLMGPFV